MKVSVIVPVFDRKDHIEQCLRSVLDQTYEDHEVIVVDDGSTDGTRTVIGRISDLRLRVYLSDVNKGTMAARNAGISLAKGDIIVFTDSDCIVDRDWLLRLVKAFDIDPVIMAVGGRVIDAPQQGYWGLLNRGQNFIARESGYIKLLIGCNMAFRREFLVRNLFDETLKYAGDDLEISMLCLTEGNKIFYAHDAVVTHYHRRSGVDVFKQFFAYGQGYTYIHIKHGKLFVLYHTNYLLILAIVGSFFAGGWMKFPLVELYLMTLFLINLTHRNKTLLNAFITYPGFLFIAMAGFLGNLAGLRFLGCKRHGTKLLKNP